jgi:hypothetical protein
MACRIAFYDEDESDPEGHVLHCNSYPCELKLSAVQWYLNTYVKGKKPGEPLVHISKYQAAKKLGITTTMLQNWTRNRAQIANQRKYSRQGRIVPQIGKESIMEHTLYRKFEEHRRTGKSIGAQWFKRYRQALYHEQYPEQVTKDLQTGCLVYQFKFSNRWFQLFCKRWNISNRCATKVAQH